MSEFKIDISKNITVESSKSVIIRDYYFIEGMGGIDAIFDFSKIPSEHHYLFLQLIQRKARTWDTI